MNPEFLPFHMSLEKNSAISSAKAHRPPVVVAWQDVDDCTNDLNAQVNPSTATVQKPMLTARKECAP